MFVALNSIDRSKKCEKLNNALAVGRQTISFFDAKQTYLLILIDWATESAITARITKTRLNF